MIIVGFLERIFGRKREETSEIIQEKKDDREAFSEEDAEKHLSKKFEEIFEPFRKDVNEIYQEIQSAATKLEKGLNELAEARFTERVDPELLQNVVAHRKSFIQKMEFMVKQLKTELRPDFDSILGYGQLISQAIHKANQNTVNDYRFVDRLFEKEGEKVIETFKVIGKLSDNLKNLIKKKAADILPIKNAQNDARVIKEYMDVLLQKKEDLKTLEIKVAGLKSKLEKEEEELKKFENEKNWIDFTKLLDKKKNTAEEISNIRSEMMKNISKIERPLKKLKNLVDRGTVETDYEKTLEKYVDSFFDTIMEEKSSEKINSILKIIQRSITEGKMDLKDEEKVDEVRFILENDVFGNILKKYISAEDDFKKLEKDVNDHIVLNRRNDMEDRIKDLKKEIEITGLEIEKNKKQLEKMENSVDERKTALQKSLALLDNKI